MHNSNFIRNVYTKSKKKNKLIRSIHLLFFKQTPRTRILEKTMVVQCFKDCPAFYKIHPFIIMFTTACRWTAPWEINSLANITHSTIVLRSLPPSLPYTKWYLTCRFSYVCLQWSILHESFLILLAFITNFIRSPATSEEIPCFIPKRNCG